MLSPHDWCCIFTIDWSMLDEVHPLAGEWILHFHVLDLAFRILYALEKSCLYILDGQATCAAIWSKEQCSDSFHLSTVGIVVKVRSICLSQIFLKASLDTASLVCPISFNIKQHTAGGSTFTYSIKLRVPFMHLFKYSGGD